MPGSLVAMGAKPRKVIALDKSSRDALERIVHRISNLRHGADKDTVIPTADIATPILDAQFCGVIVHFEFAVKVTVDRNGQQVNAGIRTW